MVDFIAMDVAFAELVFFYLGLEIELYIGEVSSGGGAKLLRIALTSSLIENLKGKKKQKLEKMKWKNRGELPSLDEEACLSTWAGWAKLIIYNTKS